VAGGAAAAAGELVDPQPLGVLYQRVDGGVEPRLGRRVETVAGTGHGVEVTTGDLALTQRVGQPVMAATHLAAAHRGAGLRLRLADRRQLAARRAIPASTSSQAARSCETVRVSSPRATRSHVSGAAQANWWPMRRSATCSGAI
jgi:hypothetical protein